jgi:hypothetical protein
MAILDLTASDLQIPTMQARKRGGGYVALSPSAYDIPRQNAWVKITFDYPDSEQAEQRVVDEHLTVLMGKDSGKVLGFIVANTKKEPPLAIVARIVDGVSKQFQRATRDLQKLNYQVIQNVVDTKLGDLLR